METADPDAIAAAYEQGLKLLVRREHSRRELGHKLAERGHDAAATEAALDRLADENALNDRRFAEEYARARFAKGFGPVRVLAELREHGIDGEGLGFARLDEDTERALAAEQYTKRFGAERPQDRKAAAKRMRYLQQRGFAPGICAAVVEQRGNPDDHSGL